MTRAAMQWRVLAVALSGVAGFWFAVLRRRCRDHSHP